MKVTSQQWIEIIKLISTFIIGVITALTVQSCTASMSISKYNSNRGYDYHNLQNVDIQHIYEENHTVHDS